MKSSLARTIQSLPLWRRALDFVFPPECVGCQQPLVVANDLMWCDECLKQLCNRHDRCCPKCGAEKSPPLFRNGRCRLCESIKTKFDRAICIGNYHDLMQRLIVSLKGRYDDALALQFGMLLGKRLQAESELPAFDMIMPAPIFALTRLRRPSHLAAVIADGVSRQISVPVHNDALRCVRQTEKQGKLDTPSRFKNVRDAFEVMRPELVDKKSVLLVDDVITSGATANELSRILRDAGARSVIVAAIARGVRQT